MKLVEIKCPSCGGKLKVDSKEPGIITCEYCGNQFLLDDEKVQNITNYNIYQYKDNGKRTALLKAFGFAGGIIAAAVLVTAAITFTGQNAAKPSSLKNVTPVPSLSRAAGMETGRQEESPVYRSELFEAAAEEIFGEPASLVTPEEAARLKYLKLDYSSDGMEISYSFEDPYRKLEGEEESYAGLSPSDIHTVTIERLAYKGRDFEPFSGLVKLDLSYRTAEDLDLSGNKELKGLSCNGVTPQTAARSVADPEQIIELELKKAQSLDGIEVFSNLEILSLCETGGNLKPLVALKKLHTLSVEDDDSGERERIKDYPSISVLTGLKSLSLKSELIKDVGFIKDLPDLKELKLMDTSIISLDSLEKAPGLVSLTLADNNEIGDFSPVGKLAGLRELIVEKMTSQPDPDLSELARLERLEISGFMSLASLKNLTGLKELSIHSCNVDDAAALQTLTGVERLTFYSVWTSGGNLRDLNFLNGMTSLKYADFNGNLDGSGWGGYQYFIEVYGDVSAVFNHEGLEELYLNGGKFEIDFDKIKENPSLRVLGMTGLELHENYYVESYGGMSSIWYDDVKLDEHTDFLTRFPNLEELYLGGNKLTGISFAQDLKKLKKLSLKDNYITDLSPLIQAESLEYLDITDNPAGDTSGLGEAVKLVQ